MASHGASHGREILGEHYVKDHLTFEEIQALCLKAMTEGGEEVPAEEMRGRILRIQDQDDASGYVVREMETTGRSTTLCYLQRA